MGFIPKNEGFICDICQTDVPSASGTFRNHCPNCLISKHVDDATPGDRAATCGGLMPAMAAEGSDPDNLNLVHRCQKCGKTMRNRTASDDNKETIFHLMRNLTPDV